MIIAKYWSFAWIRSGEKDETWVERSLKRIRGSTPFIVTRHCRSNPPLEPPNTRPTVDPVTPILGPANPQSALSAPGPQDAQALLGFLAQLLAASSPSPPSPSGPFIPAVAAPPAASIENADDPEEEDIEMLLRDHERRRTEPEEPEEEDIDRVLRRARNAEVISIKSRPRLRIFYEILFESIVATNVVQIFLTFSFWCISRFTPNWLIPDVIWIANPMIREEIHDFRGSKQESLIRFDNLAHFYLMRRSRLLHLQNLWKQPSGWRYQTWATSWKKVTNAGTGLPSPRWRPRIRSPRPEIHRRRHHSQFVVLVWISLS